MREIKFRAFSKKTKKMSIPFGLYESPRFHSEYKGKYCTAGVVPSRFLYETESETKYFYIMQYTGLKDKNGVEIYEGDILKVASNGYSNYISWTGKSCFVEYIEDRCRFIATTGEGYDTRNCFDLNCDAEIEVIGNIYENPELLE